jgi:2-oxo-4-hydroxy-4-carboxy-5-ureidoimidazoline decarboxylase
MTIDEINALDDAGFVAKFGFLFEHSPWIVAEAARRRPFAEFADMHAALMRVVNDSSDDQRLALLRAHPELAGKAAIDRTLTAESAAEQASAGLDRLTPQEYARFHALNTAYGARFGFPFIICVRLTDKAGILAAMAQRLHNGSETEMATAIDQVGEIVRIRLNELLTL